MQLSFAHNFARGIVPRSKQIHLHIHTLKSLAKVNSRADSHIKVTGVIVLPFRGTGV